MANTMKPAALGAQTGFGEGSRGREDPTLNDTSLLPDPQEAPSHGSLEMLRQCVADNLHLTAFYGDMGVGYANVGDDVGLDYALRRAVAHLRQAVGIVVMLKEQKARDAARREAAHAG